MSMYPVGVSRVARSDEFKFRGRVEGLLCGRQVPAQDVRDPVFVGVARDAFIGDGFGPREMQNLHNFHDDQSLGDPTKCGVELSGRIVGNQDLFSGAQEFREDGVGGIVCPSAGPEPLLSQFDDDAAIVIEMDQRSPQLKAG